ncbi:MAG: hypothetical protein P8Y45_07255 [Exilibacterium sp.]
MDTQAMDASALLSVWEEGLSESPLKRGLLLLAAAWPQTDERQWAQVNIGYRDSCLIALREQLFGNQLEALGNCPQCGEILELNYTTEELQRALPALVAPVEQLTVQRKGLEIACRLPNSEDLLAISAVDEQRKSLLHRCVKSVKKQSSQKPVKIASLNTDIEQYIVKEMAKADPYADIQIALECPECKKHWSQTFDILTFLWGEIQDWAKRLLQDIHTIALNYGWSERDILAMSARRRRVYLEMLGA